MTWKIGRFARLRHHRPAADDAAGAGAFEAAGGGATVVDTV
jgi:hypothetical protein